MQDLHVYTVDLMYSTRTRGVAFTVLEVYTNAQACDCTFVYPRVYILYSCIIMYIHCIYIVYTLYFFTRINVAPHAHADLVNTCRRRHVLNTVG